MNDLLVTSWLSGYDRLNRALAGVFWKQYEWLRMQRQLGMRMWTAMMPTTATPVATTAQALDQADTLEKRAIERLGKGLAPPREIYDVRNRNRIDWARVPDWAQPADPESFEGCAHEG